MSNHKLVLSVCIFLSLSFANGSFSGNKEHRDVRIFSGKISGIDQNQYHVAILRIQSNGKSRLICGGAIIDHHYVLTAAHCVYNLTNKELIIRSGWDIKPENYYEDERSFHRVFSIMYPKEYFHSYCRHHQHDLAILKVEKSFDLMDERHYKKVNLPEWDNDYEDHDVIFTGYGLHAENYFIINGSSVNKPVYPKKLRFMNTKVISNEECKNVSSYIITNSNLCTQAENKDGLSCLNDNGGPLVFEGVVVGIRNNHNLQCIYKEPEIFTRVSTYLSFIYKVLNHEFSHDIVYVPEISKRKTKKVH